MRITPHQIHNVLTAYAKRLRHLQDAADNVEAPLEVCSPEDKRRLIVSKISTNMIERMVFRRHKPGTETDISKTGETQDALSRRPVPADQFTYRMITPSGETITHHIKIEDPDFLITRMDVSARNAEKTT